MTEMTEQMKEQIVSDRLVSTHYNRDYKEKAQYLIRLIRALDNYRERDSKGRFISSVERTRGEG